MSRHENSGVEHATKRRKILHTDTVPWLFLVPLDIWVLVRDLAGAPETAVWHNVCQEFRALVTTPGFWTGFQQPEFKPDYIAHRKLLSVFGAVCRETGEPLQSLTLRWLNTLSQRRLVPLVNGLHVKELTALGYIAPETLGALSAIDSLTLANNANTHTFLQQLPNADTVTVLRLQDTKITDADFKLALSRFERLQHLDLQFCTHLTDSALPALTELRRLDLLECPQITGAGLRDLKLRELNLRKKHYLTDEGARTALTTLKHLESLSIWDLPESELALIANIKTLRHLDILDCYTGLTGTGLGLLSRLRLETLKLTLTSCTRESLSGLLALPALAELKLQNCNLRDEDLLLLQACSGLAGLHLIDCRALADLTALRGLPALSVLTLGKCPGLQSVRELQHCRRLREVEIYLCPNITTITDLQQCQSLRRLRIDFQEVLFREIQDFQTQRPDVRLIYR